MLIDALGRRVPVSPAQEAVLRAASVEARCCQLPVALGDDPLVPCAHPVTHLVLGDIRPDGMTVCWLCDAHPWDGRAVAYRLPLWVVDGDAL